MKHIVKRSFIALIMISVPFIDAQGSLSSNSSVACPDDTVTFTCTMPGNELGWRITLTDGSTPITNFLNTVNEVQPVTVSDLVLEAVLIDTSGGNATATLSTVSEVSMLEGITVACVARGGQVAGPLPIIVADRPSTQNFRTGSPEHNINSSIVTLLWDHSTPADVSVQYILSISPTPLSGSPGTVETTSVVITVSHSTSYNVVIRAENCAGTSNSSTTMIEIIACPWPLMPASGIMGIVPPSAPVVNSTLTFTCINGPSGSIPSACTSEGQWFPDPQTYDECPTEAPVTMCDPPSPPANGSIVDLPSGPLPEDTTIYYRCEDSFFPTGDQPLTCGSDGMWEPNTQDQLCSPDPFTCTVPNSPTNGFVVLTSNLTIVFGCNEGFSPQQNRTANCVAMEQWSPPIPEENMCVVNITPTASSIGPIVGGVVGGFLFLIVLIVIIIIVLLVVSSKRAKYTIPAGPVYDEVSPATNQQIQLNTNSAYCPVTPGPVYEDVLPAPKQEIELETNNAYGQVGR